MHRLLSILLIAFIFNIGIGFAQIPIYQNTIYSTEHRLQHLLDSMSILQKFAQLNTVGAMHYDKILKEDTVFSSYSMVKKFPEGIGTFSLGNKLLEEGFTASEIHYFTRQIQRHSTDRSLRVPVLFTDDLFNSIDSIALSMPYPIALAASWSPQLVEETASIIAINKRRKGIHALIGPVVAPINDPRTNNMGESFGSQPLLSSVMASAWIRGMQGNDLENNNAEKVAAVVRLSSTNTQQNLIGQMFSTKRFATSFYPTFKAITEAKVWGVIAATGYLNHTPLHFNSWVWKKVLRKKLDFEGLLISHSKEIAATSRVKIYNSSQNPFLKAIKAGIELELPEMEYENTWSKENFRYANVDSAHINNIVSKILRLKFQLGLFEEDYADTAKFEIEEAHLNQFDRVMKNATASSITLLKNEAEILPLTTKYKSIAVIGPMGNYGVLDDEKNDILTIQKAISKEKLVSQLVRYHKGAPHLFEINTKKEDKNRVKMLKEAVELAKNSDIIILSLGESAQSESIIHDEEQRLDQTNLQLPRPQNVLLEQIAQLGKPIILLLSGSKPYSLYTSFNNITAIVHCWESNIFTGEAVAKILFGNAEPKGHLPFDYPRSVGHLALINNSDFSGTALEEAILYPVGHGLSYTRYKSDTLLIKQSKITPKESLEVSIKVKNIGERMGYRTVPIFIAKQQEWFGTEPKQLKAFQNIELKIGESQIVKFELTPEMLMSFDDNGELKTDYGRFDIFTYDLQGNRISTTFEIVPNTKPINNGNDSATSGISDDKTSGN